MKHFLAATVLVLSSALVFAPASFGQQDQTEGNRKVVNRVAPLYPSMARTMNLRGSVKAEALVEIDRLDLVDAGLETQHIDVTLPRVIG